MFHDTIFLKHFPERSDGNFLKWYYEGMNEDTYEDFVDIVCSKTFTTVSNGNYIATIYYINHVVYFYWMKKLHKSTKPRDAYLFLDGVRAMYGAEYVAFQRRGRTLMSDGKRVKEVKLWEA
jgi:hypothetical protein